MTKRGAALTTAMETEPLATPVAITAVGAASSVALQPVALAASRSVGAPVLTSPASLVDVSHCLPGSRVYIFQQQSATWPTPRIKIGWSNDVASRLVSFNYDARQHGTSTWKLLFSTLVNPRPVSTPKEGGGHAVKDATELAVMRFAVGLGPELVTDQGGETYLVRDAQTLQKICDFAAAYKDETPLTYAPSRSIGGSRRGGSGFRKSRAGGSRRGACSRCSRVRQYVSGTRWCKPCMKQAVHLVQGDKPHRKQE